jgi:hypothetical protein
MQWSSRGNQEPYKAYVSRLRSLLQHLRNSPTPDMKADIARAEPHYQTDNPRTGFRQTTGGLG